MMDRKKACLTLEIPENTTDLTEIKKAYRKKAVVNHPDKHPDNYEVQNRLFVSISEAFAFLTKPAGIDEQAEFTPSWFNVVQSELNKNNEANALVTPDAHKPTINDFFLSLRRKLVKLEEKLNKANANKLIEKFEEIKVENQKKYHEYTKSSIMAAHQIVSLLQDYIKTSDPKHWETTEEFRKIALGFRLMKEFKKFDTSGQLIIVDAYSFELAQILLNHLAYLRNPLENFKSTEDRYHLMLLSDVSDRIREYHNNLLIRLDKYHDQVTITGGTISINLSSLGHRAFEMKNVNQNINDNSAQLENLKNDIMMAKEYILNYCYYPDNVDVFNPNRDSKTFRFGIAGSRRREVIRSMLAYNEIPNVTAFTVEDDIGYASYDEYEDETYEILKKAKDDNISADQIPLTGSKFIAINKLRKIDTVAPSLTLASDEADTEEKNNGTVVAVVTNSNHAFEDEIIAERFSQNIPVEPLSEKDQDFIEKRLKCNSDSLFEQYLAAELALSDAIKIIHDSEVAKSARKIQKEVNRIFDNCTRLSDKELIELTTVLTDTRQATRNDRTQEDINKFQKTANTIVGKPRWRALSISMIALGVLLIPLGIFVAATTFIPTAGLGSLIGAEIALAGVALILSGYGIFAAGRRHGVSKVMYDAKKSIELKQDAPRLIS